MLPRRYIDQRQQQQNFKTLKNSKTQLPKANTEKNSKMQNYRLLPNHMADYFDREENSRNLFDSPKKSVALKSVHVPEYGNELSPDKDIFRRRNQQRRRYAGVNQEFSPPSSNYSMSK